MTDIRNMTESELRLAAGAILKTGPWKHKQTPISESFYLGRIHLSSCAKCGKDAESCLLEPGCKRPDPVEGPLEVVAQKLLEKALTQENGKGKMSVAFVQYVQGTSTRLLKFRLPLDSLRLWWKLTVLAKLRCCLLALGAGKEEGK